VPPGGRLGGTEAPLLRVERRNSTFQVLEALKRNRAKRSELGEVFVEGVTAIKAAVGAGLAARRLVVSRGAKLSGWARSLLESAPGALHVELDPALFQELSDREEPSEILATFAVERRPLAAVELPRRGLVVALDRPSNHGNLGSTIRSADAFGFHLVVTLGHGVDLFDPAVIRASMGGVFHTPVCQEGSPHAFAAWLHAAREAQPGLTVIGTDSAGAAVLDRDAAAARPLVIVMGNEARGLSVQLSSLVDRVLRIPMVGAVDSLNVACAASIVMYEACRGG
jgi:23S rRNA (uridine2479-2'-O)-methyltransferase